MASRMKEIGLNPENPDKPQYCEVNRCAEFNIWSCMDCQKSLKKEERSLIFGRLLGVNKGGRTCSFCERTLCDDCCKWEIPKLKLLSFHMFKEELIKWHICKACYDAFVVPVTSKYDRARTDSKQVETVSINYKGKISSDLTNPQRIELTTPWFESKSDAEESLKVTAAFLGHDSVVKVDFKDKKRQEGNFEHTWWRAVGLSTNLGTKGIKK